MDADAIGAATINLTLRKLLRDSIMMFRGTAEYNPIKKLLEKLQSIRKCEHRFFDNLLGVPVSGKRGR